MSPLLPRLRCCSRTLGGGVAPAVPTMLRAARGAPCGVVAPCRLRAAGLTEVMKTWRRCCNFGALKAVVCVRGLRCSTCTLEALPAPDMPLRMTGTAPR